MKLCFVLLHVNWISTPVEAPVHGNIYMYNYGASVVQWSARRNWSCKREVQVWHDHCKGNVTAAELAVDCVLVLVA